MKNKTSIAYMAIIAIFWFSSANAQDLCGCTKEINKNQITVPYAKDGITIQFLYNKNGKFSYSGDDAIPPTFMSQIVYDNWDDIIYDFPSSVGSSKEASIQFDWAKLAKLKEHNWKSIVNKVEGKIYIGNYLDINRNHNAETIKIIDIKTDCFHPSCNPEKWVFTIMVYLCNK